MSDVAQALVRTDGVRRLVVPADLTRAALRRLLPLTWRIALRRLPAIIAHTTNSPPPKAGQRALWSHLQAERSSPLARPGAGYGPVLQRAKEQNVRQAAAAIDGTVVAPGEEFSWHRTVGPPLRLRGYSPGPELHGDQLESGVGGGVCQVSNLVYYLALHSGMRVTERHRHHLDLFADANRDVPFGCGATVFFPRRDLRFVNPLDQPLLLELRVGEGRVCGRARLLRDPGCVWEVLETNHRFVRRDDGLWRENSLARRRTDAGGEQRTEWLTDNRARVRYSGPAEEIQEG